jgi:peptide/nickel transport system permease protein
LLLSMVVIVALGFGEMNAAIAVGIASVAVFTRLMRSEVLTIKGLPFVEASHHLGGSQWQVLRRHIFPNSYGAVLSLTALQFGLAILWIAALSFLGFGAPPPAPQWGLMIAEGRNYMVSSPWMVFAPGVAITLSVLAFSRIGQFVRERLS